MPRCYCLSDFDHKGSGVDGGDLAAVAKSASISSRLFPLVSGRQA